MSSNIAFFTPLSTRPLFVLHLLLHRPHLPCQLRILQYVKRYQEARLTFRFLPLLRRLHPSSHRPPRPPLRVFLVPELQAIHVLLFPDSTCTLIPEVHETPVLRTTSSESNIDSSSSDSNHQLPDSIESFQSFYPPRIDGTLERLERINVIW